MKKNVYRTILLYLLMALMIVSLALFGNTNQEKEVSQVSPEVGAVYAAVQSNLVNSNTTFALDLYRALRKEDGNLFFSPYSISTALAMTYAGTRGETETQMKETLCFTLPQSVLHPAFRALTKEETDKNSGAQLSIANALWGQIGYPFLSDFRDTLAESYDAPLRLTDFAGATEQARMDINDWVSEETGGKIEDLMVPGSITPATRLVLANAIYFKGTWKVRFDEACTTDLPFYRLDGSQVKVPMMNVKEHFRYMEETSYKAIELPYTGDELVMDIILPNTLPNTGTFKEFEAGLDIERLDSILAQLRSKKVVLSMPKFDLTSEFSLADTLAALGMPDAFTELADFSGIDGMRDLFIGHVVHKAYVSVNEEGTEAAGASGAGMTFSVPAMMTIDRPFIFLIRDIETGTILFIGRVLDPSEGTS